MKKIIALFIVVAFSTGCATTGGGTRYGSNDGGPCYTGAAIGGVAGGLLGSLVGKGNGRVAAAAVGAGVGAVTGSEMCR